MKFFTVLIFILISSHIGASYNEYVFSSGVLYDSNVQYLSLYDKLDSDVKNKSNDALFFSNEFDGEFFFSKYGLLLSFECFTIFSPWLTDASKGEVSFSVLKQFDFSDKWKTELGIENSILGETHSSVFFSYFKTALKGTAVYKFNEYFDFYASVNGGFISGIDSVYKYISGPIAGFEGGFFIYPDMDDDFIRVSIGNAFYMGRDEKIYTAENQMIYVNNRFARLYFLVNGEFMLFNGFLTGMAGKSEFSSWLAEDYENYSRWRKRRTDILFSSSLYLRYYFNENAAAEFFTGFENVFSNFGNENADYVDYNYFQVMSSLKFIFFI